MTPAKYRDVDIAGFVSPNRIIFDHPEIPPDQSAFSLNAVVASNYLKSITVSSTTLPAVTLRTVDATFSVEGGVSIWTWSGPGILPAAGKFSVRLEKP